jgi:Ser-tRNA(Ala) deacylase AlaX
MPDGGVHVKSTKEIGKIWVANISQQDNNTLVRYGIAD